MAACCCRRRRNRSILRLNMLMAVSLFCSSIGKTVQSCLNEGILLKSGLGPSDKYNILEEHNKLRQAVAQGLIPGQPAAENMLEMQWDNELAAKAQEWADQCLFKHDPKKRLGRFNMGQNLALVWSGGSLEDDRDTDFPGRIRKWFDEVKKYSFGERFSLSTGHYMQLVWADSFLVGCGYSYYYYGNKYNKLYVCNYGPGGNVQGQQPYVTGRPSCEQFGLQKSRTYPSLCMPGGVDPYHHNNVIPPNYYSYRTSSNNHGNQHYTSAYPSAATNSNHQLNDNNILLNLIFDQNKQQQHHYQTPQSPHQQIQQHLPSPSAAAAALLKPGNIFKSPLLSYRWDLLFNFLH
ncbi:venom allergen 5 [Toxorhynchites rutilus septentrionalis]|uniref:venom allergen 5 n=1 Tax=Toxorhynchites rutilus septentrionalis TaxID=329112 RepID=UPI00247AEB47|nr:venom allergen 5 [Toxorhynchites rutilus septentrionalis]XP_055617986.1 venom allergen 5 [Toxorhynchites rutilus septentrionalis]XP_055617987.1 venom allergen 5 [Toxorhynchites rutilus septentrionalis]